MSKERTKDEMREMFLDECRGMCDYWANLPGDRGARERIDGAMFSLLVLIDGSSGGFPAAIDLVMRPHEDDKQFCIDEDEDYVVDGQVINDDCHLHDLFYKE